MGEWSDYFEEVPEGNPANYDKNGTYHPNGLLRQEQAKQDVANKKLDELLKKKGMPT